MVNRRSLETTLTALSGHNGSLQRLESPRPTAFASEGGLVRFQGSQNSDGPVTTTVSEKTDVDTDEGNDDNMA